MDLAAIRTTTRQRLDDAVGPSYLWSDAELDEFANEAVTEACIRARLNTDSSSEAAKVNVIAGIAAYPLHASVLFIERAYLDTSAIALSKTSFHELDELSGTWPTESGTPTQYIQDMDHASAAGTLENRLTLYPIPTVTETLSLTVYRLPMVEMSSDGDEPEIPPHLHLNLVDWMCHRAYMKGDADTLDTGKALVFERRFEKRFGPRPSARLVEWRRKQRPKRVTGRWL